MSALPIVLEGVLALVKQGELARALDCVNEARRKSEERRLEARQGAVQAATTALLHARRQRAAIEASIAALPPDVRLAGEHGLLPVLDRYLCEEILRLQGQRRRLGSP
jgi:hypothetical protein